MGTLLDEDIGFTAEELMLDDDIADEILASQNLKKLAIFTLPDRLIVFLRNGIANADNGSEKLISSDHVTAKTEDDVLPPLKFNVPELQLPFQPGATPSHLSPRFLAYNNIGFVTQVVTEIDNTIDVEFTEGAISYPLPVGRRKFSMASLSDTAIVLAGNLDPVTVTDSFTCRYFASWDSFKEWTMQLPDDERVEAVAASSQYVAVGTSMRQVRVFTLSGLQLPIVCVAGRLVCMSADEDGLLVVTHDMRRPHALGEQALRLLWLSVDVASGTYRRVCDYRLNVSAGAALAWAGFSNARCVFTVDTCLVVRCLSLSLLEAGWIHVADLSSALAHPAHSLWIVGVDQTRAMVGAVLCKDAPYPAVNPRPVVQWLPITVPLCDAASQQTQLESDLWRLRLLAPFSGSVELQEILMKLFATVCKDERDGLAMDVCGLMRSTKMLTMAAKYANVRRRQQLAARIGELLSGREALDAEQPADVSPSSAAPLPLVARNWATCPPPAQPPRRSQPTCPTPAPPAVDFRQKLDAIYNNSEFDWSPTSKVGQDTSKKVKVSTRNRSASAAMLGALQSRAARAMDSGQLDADSSVRWTAPMGAMGGMGSTTASDWADSDSLQPLHSPSRHPIGGSTPKRTPIRSANTSDLTPPTPEGGSIKKMRWDNVTGGIRATQFYSDDVGNKENRVTPLRDRLSKFSYREAADEEANSGDRPDELAEAAGVDAAEPSLRTILVPADLLRRFIDLAAANTDRDVETCALLYGHLAPDELGFVLTHLVVPKQTGTSVSCTSLHEEELVEFQQQNGTLNSLGWIHTHPSHSAFLSSIDLHMQLPYQRLLPEALAIVYSAKYSQTGYFRLTPRGMQLVSQCKQSGHHVHTTESTLFEVPFRCLQPKLPQLPKPPSYRRIMPWLEQGNSETNSTAYRLRFKPTTDLLVTSFD